MFHYNSWVNLIWIDIFFPVEKYVQMIPVIPAATPNGKRNVSSGEYFPSIYD